MAPKNELLKIYAYEASIDIGKKPNKGKWQNKTLWDVPSKNQINELRNPTIDRKKSDKKVALRHKSRRASTPKTLQKRSRNSPRYSGRNEITERHNQVAGIINWNICSVYGNSPENRGE